MLSLSGFTQVFFGGGWRHIHSNLLPGVFPPQAVSSGHALHARSASPTPMDAPVPEALPMEAAASRRPALQSPKGNARSTGRIWETPRQDPPPEGRCSSASAHARTCRTPMREAAQNACTTVAYSQLCCDAHAATCRNLCQNLPRLRAPLARGDNALTIILLELPRTCARTCLECVHRFRLFRTFLTW